MLPTYSFSEVKGFIKFMDVAELVVLRDLLQDEHELYPAYESRAIYRLIKIQEVELARNPVQLAFLLAYN